ncbi:SDR family NAD(P)-dependent oxidoreductase [Amycolatopsis sp. NPDC051371]|uniref:SDR family NAD(P)-dependent oxidoreductase n=1 Tax=Amycolatopsis sp. NPDC051371 TaxID=3155800 RepID=UPI003414EC89
MSTFALVGAGPGLGLATARRFGATGHTVALIARDAERLEVLTASLSRDGVQARAFQADVLDRGSLTTALQAAGPVEILQFAQLIVPGAIRARRGEEQPGRTAERCSTSIRSVTAPVTSPNPRQTHREIP